MIRRIRENYKYSLLLSLLSVGSGYFITFMLWEFIKPFSYIQFLFFVVLSAWIGGFKSGILTTFVSFFIIILELTYFNTFIFDIGEIIRLMSYLIIGIVISVLFEKNYRSEEQYRYWNENRNKNIKDDILVKIKK